MALPEFLTSLFADGRVAVPAPGDVSAAEREGALAALAEFERTYRMNLPGEAPEFHPEAATWAAVRFYRACQYGVFRDAAAFAFEPLQLDANVAASAGVQYSVDLTFRFLPDLVKFAHAASADDPLTAVLMEWARAWPLSSVGVAGVTAAKLSPAALAAVLECECLRGLYVDRVLARGDASRIDGEPMREAVRAAVGLHEELAPGMGTRQVDPPRSLSAEI